VRHEDLRPALERALAAGKPACVNVLTDPAVISPVTIAMVGGAAQADAPSGAAGETVIPYYDNLDETKG
jgi:acetolactate synthase-1/2/3 large subunit